MAIEWLCVQVTQVRLVIIISLSNDVHMARCGLHSCTHHAPQTCQREITANLTGPYGPQTTAQKPLFQTSLIIMVYRNFIQDQHGKSIKRAVKFELPLQARGL